MPLAGHKPRWARWVQKIRGPGLGGRAQMTKGPGFSNPERRCNSRRPIQRLYHYRPVELSTPRQLIESRLAKQFGAAQRCAGEHFIVGLAGKSSRRAEASSIKYIHFPAAYAILYRMYHSRPPTQPLTGHSNINGRRTNSRLCYNILHPLYNARPAKHISAGDTVAAGRGHDRSFRHTTRGRPPQADPQSKEANIRSGTGRYISGVFRQ